MRETLLSNLLQSITPISENFGQFIADYSSTHSFVRGDQLLYIPPVSNTIYFVEKGLLCGTKSLDESKLTLWFSNEGHFIVPDLISSDRYFTERFEFLTPSVIIGIKIERLFKAMDTYPECKILGIAILDRHIKSLQEREYLLRLPSDARYERAFRQHPHYFIESNNDHLASYLRLSIRHFNRIKKEFSSSKI